MQTTFALAALASVAFALPQGVTETIAPQAAPPAGCSLSQSGSFQLEAVNFTATPKQKRDTSCGAEGVLTVDLAGGKLTDSKKRTGYIASNFQFQFDAPPQTGTIYSGGFSVCGNGSLALGGSAVFYQCYSGGFYNLYDRSWAAQCNPILLQTFPCGATGAGVGQSADGQPTGTATGKVSQISDGQAQATTAVPKPTGPVSQIGDGQVQATTAVPPKPAAPITQIGDGQVQAPSVVPKPNAPISQIGDGQVQATTASPPKPTAPISQIGDGQVQATTAAPPKPNAPISQIGDGQVQATTAAPPKPSAPISQIGDGQIQATSAAPKPTGGIVSQIPDGQVQANATKPAPTSPPVPLTGAASNMQTIGSQFAAIAIGIFAVAFL
jgi:hypothetical protein